MSDSVSMERKIKIVAGGVTAEAKLSPDNPTADAIWDALPLESTCNLWGDEIYFTIPVSLSLDRNAKEIVQKGDLGYWPDGPAFCIFFGPTPISRGGAIKPASAVNIFGEIIGSSDVFKQVTSRATIRVEKVMS
jgi:hypothetical protein